MWAFDHVMQTVIVILSNKMLTSKKVTFLMNSIINMNFKINSFIRKARESITRDVAGGLLLVLATTVALVTANTGLSDIYFQWLQTPFIIGFEETFHLRLTVQEWINDGLMTIFFLAVGLEIKRELLVGELSTVKSAAMPMIAALGGMVIPAAIFVLFNTGTPTARGWGIPMATDIAYALAFLALLRHRVPVQLKIFLTALAIADDLGAIIVISLFYSTHIVLLQMAAAGGFFLLLVLINRLQVKLLWPYVLLGTAFWLCFVHSGVHPTIAGVWLAFTAPVKPHLTTRQFKRGVKEFTEKFRKTDFEILDPLAKEEQLHIMEALGKQVKRASPLLLRMERGLQKVNAYFVIPVFALANAGVAFDLPLRQVVLEPLTLGIVAGLVLGKVLGITAFSFFSAKLGLTRLPEGVSWKHIMGMGFLAGIGFTLSLFVTNLAFADDHWINVAKIAILMASLMAAVTGVAFLLALHKKERTTGEETP